MTEKKKGLLFFLLSLFLSLLLEGAPFFLSRVLPDLGNVSVLLYALFLYVLHPAGAIFFPFLLTGKYRVPSLLTFFHFGLFLLLLPCYPDGKITGLVCLLLGILGASAAEAKHQLKEGKRRKTRK